MLAELAASAELAATVARVEPDARPPARRSSCRRAAPLRGSLGDAARAPAVEPRRRARGRCALARARDGARRGLRAASARPAALPRPVPSAGALYPLELYVARRSPSTGSSGASTTTTRSGTGSHGSAPLAWRDAAGGPRRRRACSTTRRRCSSSPPSSGGRASSTGCAATASRCSRPATSSRTPCSPRRSSACRRFRSAGFYDRRLDALVGADGLDEATRLRARARRRAHEPARAALGAARGSATAALAVAARRALAAARRRRALLGRSRRSRLGVARRRRCSTSRSRGGGRRCRAAASARSPSRPRASSRLARGRRGDHLAAGRARRAAPLGIAAPRSPAARSRFALAHRARPGLQLATGAAFGGALPRDRGARRVHRRALDLQRCSCSGCRRAARSGAGRRRDRRRARAT